MFSVFVYLVLTFFIEMPFWVLGFVLLATVFVDIDAWNSKGGNQWYLRPFQWVTRHRGFLHSLFVGLILSLIVGGFSNWAGFGFFVGYVSHLFLDCLTLSGVRFFWPLKFRIRGFVKSGSWVEDVVFVLLLILDFLLLLFFFWSFFA